MKIQKDILYIGIIIILAATTAFMAYQLFAGQKSSKEGYVLTDKVYQEYAGTGKQMKSLKQLRKKHQDVLDSLRLQVRKLEASPEKKPAEVEKKRKLYNRMRKEFNKDLQKQKQQKEEALWKQINSYIRAYGDKRGYTYIHGANGSGNLMYADSARNITDEVIDYINKQYKQK